MIFEILRYGFMQKAFVTGIVVAIACSILGIFLILRRQALIGDGLAHISFGGIASAMLFNVLPILGALVFAVIGALGILKITEKADLHGDTAIGIVSHASLGIGIFIASIASGFNVDLMSYLFGSILSIKMADMVLSILLALVVIFVIFLFYRDILYLTFDEESARTSGVKVSFISSLLVILTAVTIVSSMRVVGLLLASSLLIIPAASALQFNLSFKKSMFIAVIIAVFSVVLGLIIAYEYDFAVSGTIVLLNTVMFLVILIIKKIIK